MAYFLRKTKRKNGDDYFQIYDSYYSLSEKKNRNRHVETLGPLSKLRKEGETPAGCEARLKEETAEEIGDGEQLTNYGCFLMERMADRLGVRDRIGSFFGAGKKHPKGKAGSRKRG